MKQRLIRMTRILVCALFLMLSLSVALAEGTQLSFTPGTYSGIGYGHNGRITVSMTFSENEILDISILEHGETAGICEVALEKMPQRVLDSQSLGVDTVSSATDTSNGLLTAMEDCVTQAGGNVELLKSVLVEKEDRSENVSDVECDVCVIGAGISGSIAAVQASDLGAKVVILEKTSSTGVRGASFFIASSHLLEEAKQPPVDVGVFFKAFMQDTSWRADGTLVRDWLEMTKSMIGYLERHGCKFEKTEVPLSGGHSYEGGFGCTNYDTTAGTEIEQIRNALMNALDASGGKLYLDTTATDLLTDEKGQVCGVTARQADGSTLRVHARSVILATGGYNADFDWVSHSYNGVVPTSNFGLQTNLGDGIKMAEKLGAARIGEQAVMLRMPRLLGDFNTYNDFESGDGKVKLGKRFQYAIPLLPMTLWVNSSGERFADENEVCYNRNYCGNVVMSQGGYVYIVMNEEMLRILAEQGAGALGMEQAQGMGYINNYTLLEQGWGDVFMVADGLVEQGVAFKGDTIEELAKSAGMNPAILSSTLKTYNASCSAGTDDTFFKDAQFLWGMDKGPYYMFTENVNVLTTLGGLHVSRYMEVQSMNAQERTYDAIPNLYACGTCTGGFYGDHYANAEGVAQSFCMTSARTAACYAVNNALGSSYHHLELGE